MADTTPRQLDILASERIAHAAALEGAAEDALRNPRLTPRLRFQRAEQYRQQAAALLVPVLYRALADLTAAYVELFDNVAPPLWQAKDEPCVQAARAALAAVPPGARGNG